MSLGLELPSRKPSPPLQTRETSKIMTSLSSTDKLCAVVVPDSVQLCHDVLPASANLTKCTPFPFGLSVYSHEENQQTPKYMQRMIYVSNRVARDRAPEMNSMNGTGVRPGWYLIAKPGLFKVFVSYVNRKQYGLPRENGLAVDLEVDGHNTNIEYECEQNQDTLLTPNGGDWEFGGFLKKSTPFGRSKNLRRDTIWPFAFEHLLKARKQKKVGSSNVGTIKLNVYIGVRKACEERNRTETFKYSEKKVSAKTVAREGTTMRVSQRESALSFKVEYSNFYLSSARILDGAELRIYVREPSWLQSRRLIDENELPITYDAFCELLESAQRSVTISNTIHEVINIDDEEPVRKKRKVKDCINLEDGHEIIDLT